MKKTTIVRFLRLFSLIVLMPMLVGMAVYVISAHYQKTQYTARAMSVAGIYYVDPSSDDGDGASDLTPAEIKVNMVTQPAFLQSVIDAGQFDLSVEQLSDMLSARVINDTSLYEIIGIHPDPVLVVQVVDEVAMQLISQSDDSYTEEQKLFIAEVELLRKQFDDNRLRLGEIEKQLAVATDPDDIKRLSGEYDRLVTQIDQDRETEAELDSVLAELTATSVIEVFETARLIGTVQTGPNPAHYALAAYAGCTALTFGFVLIREYRASRKLEVE